MKVKPKLGLDPFLIWAIGPANISQLRDGSNLENAEGREGDVAAERPLEAET